MPQVSGIRVLGDLMKRANNWTLEDLKGSRGNCYSPNSYGFVVFSEFFENEFIWPYTFSSSKRIETKFYQVNEYAAWNLTDADQFWLDFVGTSVLKR